MERSAKSSRMTSLTSAPDSGLLTFSHRTEGSRPNRAAGRGSKTAPGRVPRQTGDLVEMDADGFVWFRGRKKEIIVRGGSNISPQEVEETLYQHPAVTEYKCPAQVLFLAALPKGATGKVQRRALKELHAKNS